MVNGEKKVYEKKIPINKYLLYLPFNILTDSIDFNNIKTYRKNWLWWTKIVII